MSYSPSQTGLELRTLIRENGELELSLVRQPVPEPAYDEIVVRIEATPINPSDLALLFGPADMANAFAAASGDLPVVRAQVPKAAMRAMAGRLDQSLPAGNEGAGTVVAAGASDAAKALIGRQVALWGGGNFVQYRAIKAEEVLVLPEDLTAADGASCFVNPLTSLGMVETMRREGHKALVHTAAASNLGQMLNKICLKDGVGLVNIVRNAEQESLLRGIGAVHVCNSASPGFTADLTRALIATGATLAFDAIGGGPLASQILDAMETAASATAATYSRYGSTVHKQVYIYGLLDPRPTELTRGFGFAWGVGGWLLTPFLGKLEPADLARLKQRVVDELKTTFASRYSRVISLPEALQLEVIAAYNKRATGEKFLINPQLGT